MKGNVDVDTERFLRDLGAVLEATGARQEQLASRLAEAEPAHDVVFPLLAEALGAERAVLKRAQEPLRQRWRSGLVEVAIARLQEGLAEPLPVKHLLRQLEKGPEVDSLKEALEGYREACVRDLIADGTVSWATPVTRATAVGEGLDERVIELPLAFEQLQPRRAGRALDAGAALNLPLVHEEVRRGRVRLTHFTQSGEREVAQLAADRFGYAFGDLRDLPYRDGWFDRVLCVSTLEHVGMDNTRYGGPQENAPGSHVDAIVEMMRVLAPGGSLFLTFPTGAHQDNGWFQVFDRPQVKRMVEATRGASVSLRSFAYQGSWVDAESVLDAEPPAMTDAEAAGQAVLGMTAIVVVKARDGATR